MQILYELINAFYQILTFDIDEANHEYARMILEDDPLTHFSPDWLFEFSEPFDYIQSHCAENKDVKTRPS